MGHIEWAMWANEQAVVSGVALLMGSIIGVAGNFMNWQFSAFAIFVSVAVLILEWPRSRRQKGKTMQRRYQLPLTKFLNKLMPFSSNYYVRALLHVVLSVPCCFLLPTIMGGMSLMIAAIIYIVAAMKGEQWQPAGLEEKSSNAEPDAKPRPTRPPPRSPQVSQQQIEENAV